jgi:hypothetical protein
MLRKIVLASIMAASLGLGFAGVITPASAEHWGGPRHGYDRGYGSGHGYGYGPPPWVVRRWQWRRHHSAPPAFDAPHSGRFYGQPPRRHPHW